MEKTISRIDRKKEERKLIKENRKKEGVAPLTVFFGIVRVCNVVIFLIERINF